MGELLHLACSTCARAVRARVLDDESLTIAVALGAPFFLVGAAAIAIHRWL